MLTAYVRIALCCLLMATGLQAQRGGGMGHGGFGGGGFHGGFGGFHGGVGGFHGGFGGFRGGFVNGGFGRGFVGRGFWGWPRWGWGGSLAYYWPGSYYPYYPYYPYGYSTYPTDSSYYGYGYGYGSSPNVVVIYPQPQATAPAYYPPSSGVRDRDEYSYENSASGASRSGSPTYLIALKNHVIYDAASYWVKGDTIYFITTAKEQKSSPLIMVDRAFSVQLNLERGVNFQLP